MKRRLLMACIAGATPCIARAQIGPIGPFVGLNSEDFEAICSPACMGQCFNVLPGGGPSGGASTVCTGPAGSAALHIGASWSGQCLLGAHGGASFLAGVGGPVEITFAVMVDRFGGLFADAEMQGSATAEFFDLSGAPIGPPLPLTLNACTWTWNGWQSSGPPIKRVRISGAAGTIQLDDLQSDRICYPDCNGSGTLTASDWPCFQTRWVMGDPYADCDSNGSLTVADFGCYRTRFVQGCP